MATLAKHHLHAPWAVQRRVAHRRPKPEPSDLRTMLIRVGALYGVLAFLVCALIGLDFVVAWLVTGTAY
jgi:hypothetical protein